MEHRKKLMAPLDKEKAKGNLSLSMSFAILIFFILLVSIVTAIAIVKILTYFGVFITLPTDVLTDYNGMMLLAVLTSLVVGMSLALLVCKFPLRPLTKMKTQLNRLAGGDYDADLHFGYPLNAHPTFVEVEESFNKLAKELESTEMLRSDFINNFSHEFKTPIVSIAGFAKLLKYGNLTPEQKAEYIDVIEEESLRLANMATNVLNLTKVENQTILSDTSVFNVSEQIRSCVLLLETSWSRKSLDLRLDFDEFEIEASEELLKQVWINLIDNAVKYSPEGGFLDIAIGDAQDEIVVSVKNPGDISPEAKLRIWNKFYQADESHSSVGNGIGLAIVRRVIELHGGSVNVDCSGGVVTFTVSLPKHQ